MNTRLFLEELEAYLKTDLDDASVQYHLDYYRNYIEMEVEEGKNEFEVIETLGNPRVIGKNIVLTWHMDNDMKAGTQAYKESKEHGTTQNKSLPERIKKYAVIAALIFIIIFILALVLKVAFLVLPILLIFAVLSYLIKNVGKR